MADQVVIVCKDAELGVIEAVMRQVGLGERIRGFITEVDLIAWYAISMSPKYGATLGRPLLAEVARQFELEFPGSNSDALDLFFLERGYNSTMLTTIWTT